jgi:hypothetical protein
LRRATLASADPSAESQPAVDRLRDGLTQAGIAARISEPDAANERGEVPIVLRLTSDVAATGDTTEREAYRLRIAPSRVEIQATAPAGLYYGVETFLQWLSLHPPAGPGAAIEAPAVRIDDRPRFRHRGFLLDISRNRVPTLDSLLRLVEMMGRLRLNQLQLYTEHTFAYRGHEAVWRDASPLTADDLLTLDAHCHRHFVELVPNQNSFGHLHHWLRHDQYRALAEVPQGMPHPFGDETEPFSLCPTDPAAIEFLSGLYDQLLPLFTSRRFNVGCDETFDLGKGRSADACRERGTGRVYVEFLQRLHRLVADRGRQLQFWGDILAGHPELLAEVPADATALEWGYEAGHPFDERAAALAEAGLDFYLCPGTSSWNSFGGRLENAIANLSEATRAGIEHGASGLLITDWGDFGHLQPAPVSWPAMVAGAMLAWNPEAADPVSSLPLAELVDRHTEPGLATGTGEVLLALGEIYRAAGVTPMNASALFKLVVFWRRKLADAGLGELTSIDLDRAEAAVSEARQRLGALDTATPASRLVARELRWAAEMMRFACRLGRARLSVGGGEPLTALPVTTRRELAHLLSTHIDELSPIWHARSRPGGFEDSRRRLDELRDALTG